MASLFKVANHVLTKSYGLKNIKRIEKIDSIGPNINLLIYTEYDRYILQHSFLEPHEIKRKLDFTLIFKNNGIPVNEILSDNNGNRIISSNSGSWMLKKYLNGTLFTMNSYSQIKSAAIMLAKIHRIPFENTQYNFISDHDPYHWLTNFSGEIKLLENEVIESASLYSIKRILDTIENTYTIKEYFELPRAVVHGDYHGRNLLFENNKISGVLDFDTTGISAKVVDVAEGAFLMGRIKNGGYEFNIKAVREFLVNYEKNITMTEEEARAIKVIFKIRMIPRAKYLKLLKKKSCLAAENQIKWSIKMIEAIDACECLF